MKLLLRNLGIALVCLGAPYQIKAQDDIEIKKKIEVMGRANPVWVHLEGFSGEALQVLQFDLYIQGFNFTNNVGAEYIITGSNNGNLVAKATDNLPNKNVKLSKSYANAPIRRQVHVFVDDFMKSLERKPICQTRIAFKGLTGQNSEIFFSDFDGQNAQQVTTDNSIVAAPAWAPGHSALYYTSYKLNHADIFYHDLSGSRKSFARYGGSNMSPAVSPDGTKVAMILSKDGWTDLYVCNSNGSDLRRLTKSPQDESSPCWSPDGKWICYASKEKEHRALRKISPSGGESKVISTGGVPNPTEPEWSPDGKWIAFTSQTRDFTICVVLSTGGEAALIAPGEDASWAPNSRTLICARRTGNGYVLSLIDAPTKQAKDVSRIAGSNSQSQPNWAK